MRSCAAFIAALVALLPTAAFAQYGYGVPPRSPSVIRQAGAWENYMHVPDGHCGCPMPVRCNDYHHCCNTCGIRPVCLLKRFGRMLDCLLPCNCCHGGLLSCGGHGCCSGCGGYGGYGHSWETGHAVGCGCDAPGLTDPFVDDPMPPVPAPDEAKEVRSIPMRKLPQQIARDPRPDSQARSMRAVPARKPIAGAHRNSPNIAARPAVTSEPGEKSVLRRTSFEGEVSEPAEFQIEAAEASPIGPPPLPAIPINPLRAGR
jgi:hypothetical protein